MIELNTGVPGSGKTLSMVQRLAKLQARWEAHPDEARPVFVLGIPDLALPHSPVPLASVQIQKAGAPSLVPDWDAMPDGSLVIIDEAQGCFPPRSSASASPGHVAWLNTHRHKGFDIWITTQHPKLIDGTVRALVGKHQHYRRLFGGARAVVYEWDCCSDSLSGFKTATKSYYSYPKSVFKFYKSAEIHTKQSFKVPFWVFVPLLGVVLGVFALPRAYAVLSSGMSGQGLKGVDADKSIGASGTVSPAAQAPGALAPAGAKAGVMVPIAKTELQLISACIASETRCQCYTHHGIKLQMAEQKCRDAAHSPNEDFRFLGEEQSTAVAVR